MVNIRTTLDAAMAEGILDRGLAAQLPEIGKALFYKRRNWPAILRLADRRLLFAGFTKWLPGGEVI